MALTANDRLVRGSFRQRVLGRLDRLRDALAPGALKGSLLRLQRRLGITRTGQVAVLGAVLLWITARLIAGTAVYIVAYGAVLFVVVGFVIAPRRLKLTAERTGLFPRANEGDRLDVTLTLHAKKGVSTFVLEEQVPTRLGSTVRVPVASLRPNAEVNHSYGLRCGRRGVYQVGPLVAVTSDPLGFSQVETVVAAPYELLVHPRVENVRDRPLTRQFEDPPVRPPVSKPWPSGLEFYGMREYAPGDDLRRIVWRATARTGKVMVREAEQGITDKITIILDTDRGTHSQDEEGLSESFEAAIRVAASLGVRHLRDGYEVKCEVNGGPLTRSMRGGGKQLLFLDALTRLDMSRDPLTKGLMRIVATGRRDTHNILITPQLGAPEASQLRLLLNTGVSVLVVVLLWNDDHADSVARAAGLGCQVVGLHPGQEIAAALHGSIGVGGRN